MTERITDVAEARALADRIMAPRSRPLVVVSTDPVRGGFGIDVDRVAEEISDVCDVVLIETGAHTFALSDRLPPRAQVYGGAGRSYPVDFGGNPDVRRSPLRFPVEGAADTLSADALSQAHAAGLFAEAKPRRVVASGRVHGFLLEGSRALVDVEGAGLATVPGELIHPWIPLDWLLGEQQTVAGTLDLDSKRFLFEIEKRSADALRAAFPHGSVTSVLVRSTTRGEAELMIHPDLPITVRREDLSPNPHDTVEMLLSEGDVVGARVVHLSSGRMHLRLSDVDDDEPVLPSLPLVAGGPPWLVEGRSLPDRTAGLGSEAADPGSEASGPGSTARGAVRAEPEAERAMSETEPVMYGGEEGIGPAGSETGPSDPDPPAIRAKPGPGVRRIGATAPSPVPSLPLDTAPEPHSVDPGASPASPRGSKALQQTQLQLQAARARISELEAVLADTGGDAELERLRARATGAEDRLREELIERAELQRALWEYRDRHRESARTLRTARKAQRTQAHADSQDVRRERWLTADDWIRHEIYLAWVERVPAVERAEWPLREYEIGGDFDASLAPLDEDRLVKALRAAVDAITGRIKDIPSREVHALRSGDGGSDPEVVREDGARCMRAYIEQKTPSARRLHYWVVSGGSVELSRIALHDDTRP